ncbi:class I SAM-dependent methyltransferase [Microbacterium sp. APC 3898]|uniref:Class I SAM-dependent methyltransferase n=2 Tax=Planococcus TaxID=1372 RepID=A0ABT7ZPF5_9BACL|nr:MULTISPECIES: class I SAM-dependent methyltransferase [Terrabacteria group]MBD8016685.1 class I SAM-dependent methyltransferase [Planococcus wigleyi]MDN3429041.1 class I SAM-dependent methyltransferase [Planococcus sp. APC 4016]MDN3500808.1 class I SAM-dependent methyltransferase [Microbacterium sp. APC 3898]
MSQHYYSKNPQTKSNPREWTDVLRGEKFRFQTDAGVFSKSEVDFGSRLLIETFQGSEIDGPVLDVGCGYGPIGMAVAKAFPQKQVHMVDVNTRAIELAKTNVEKNDISNAEIYESDGLSAVGVSGFSAILTNPPIRAGKDTIFRFYEEAAEKLADGGSLWVVIQKKQGAPSTQVKLEELFGEVKVADKKKGYFIFEARKV